MKYNLTIKVENINELTNILQTIQENNNTKVKLSPTKIPGEDIQKEIKDLIEELITGGKRDAIIEIFKAFKASKFSDIPKENHVDVLKLLRGLEDER